MGVLTNEGFAPGDGLLCAATGSVRVVGFFREVTVRGASLGGKAGVGEGRGTVAAAAAGDDVTAAGVTVASGEVVTAFCGVTEGGIVGASLLLIISMEMRFSLTCLISISFLKRKSMAIAKKMQCIAKAIHHERKRVLLGNSLQNAINMEKAKEK